MQVARVNIKPGFLRTMRGVMMEGSPITPELRKGFLERPFPKQAALIGIYAKNQLKLADKIITDRMAMNLEPRIETPRAVDVWKKMVECDKLFTDEVKIKILFPFLANESSVISRKLKNIYTLWVDNFYTDGEYEGFGPLPYEFSKARLLSADETQIINDKSGMPYLGQVIKSYAEHCYEKDILMRALFDGAV
jgi:hypothetical protein